tara:strand:- start:492 stop:1430 length:939 start_codon:yes stop_codon:yes gene_type:complete
MKKIFYKILQKIINFKDKKKKFFFNDFCEEINFLDIGAAEGLDARWDLLKERINFFFVEPHPESSKDLSAEKKNIITKVFDEKPGLLKEFFLTNKPTCSSFLKPNISYLNKFEDANRYNINKILKFETTTVDKEFENLSLDFVKIDTQGSELNILKGSNNSLKEILGLEIECEFFKIYENQPLFEDIKNYLENYNLLFFDFIDIIRWERDKFTHLGQPQFADILFLRTPENVIDLYNKGEFSLKKLKNYILILTIYNKRDLLVSLQINLKKINLELDINNFVELTKNNSKYLNMIDRYSLILKRLINRRDRN